MKVITEERLKEIELRIFETGNPANEYVKGKIFQIQQLIEEDLQ